MISDKFGNLWPTSYTLCPECKQPDNCGDCNHAELSADDVRQIGGVPGTGDMTKTDAVAVIQEIAADYFALNERHSRIWEAVHFVCDVTEEHGDDGREP